MGRAVCDAWRTPPAPVPMTQLQSCKLALIVLFFDHYVHGDAFLTGRTSPVKKEMMISLTFVWVRMLFSFALGLLKVSLTEDVCSSEAKSQAPTPRCHLSLSYYTPAFTGGGSEARHDTLWENCRLDSTGPVISRDFWPVNWPDHPAPQGVEIHPICLQRALVLLLAGAIVHCRTCRLDSKGQKLIGGESNGSTSEWSVPPYQFRANKSKTVLSIVCYTCGGTGLVGCASQAGLHGRRYKGSRVNNTAPRRWRDEASIFFFGPVLFDLSWIFYGVSLRITSSGNGSGSALI